MKVSMDVLMTLHWVARVGVGLDHTDTKTRLDSHGVVLKHEIIEVFATILL